jgi:hypothetical protein|eukprot:COSAG02_NODE_3767_length_6268_cov_2.428757_8_plen_58_part_00
MTDACRTAIQVAWRRQADETDRGDEAYDDIEPGDEERRDESSFLITEGEQFDDSSTF